MWRRPRWHTFPWGILQDQTFYIDLSLNYYQWSYWTNPDSLIFHFTFTGVYTYKNGWIKWLQLLHVHPKSTLENPISIPLFPLFFLPVTILTTSFDFFHSSNLQLWNEFQKYFSIFLFAWSPFLNTFPLMEPGRRSHGFTVPCIKMRCLSSESVCLTEKFEIKNNVSLKNSWDEQVM